MNSEPNDHDCEERDARVRELEQKLYYQYSVERHLRKALETIARAYPKGQGYPAFAGEHARQALRELGNSKGGEDGN